MKGKNTVVATLLLTVVLSLSIPIAASANEYLDAVDDEASQESVTTEVSSGAQALAVQASKVAIENLLGAAEAVEQVDEPEEEIVVNEEDEPVESSDQEEYHWDGAVLTASKGTNQGPSGKETYYNLDMSGIVSGLNRGGWVYTQCVDQSLIDHILDTSGYWIRDDGCKMFGDYIMVAANLSVHPRGSLVPTSLGMGIVIDTGGFAYGNPNQLDIATNW